MATTDPYETLGVSRGASQDEIKGAYRNLAKKYHPDFNPGNKEAESRFKDLTDAYERIGSPENRKKYDRGDFDGQTVAEGMRGQRPFYRNTQDRESGGGRYTYTFGEGLDEDLFQSIFEGFSGTNEGLRGKRRTQIRGEDHLYHLEISLSEAILGAEKQIQLSSEKKLVVKIPPGVEEGVRLRFAGQGGSGIQGGPPGDTYVVVHIKEDERFKRQGDDLLSELPISITEAVFGGEVKAPTVEGDVLLRIPPRSNTGRKLKLSGKGFYNRRTQRRGDQLVVLKVMLPDVIDPGFESALRTWEDHLKYNPREKGAA